MIESFACAETEKVSHAQVSRDLPPDIQRTARPGNRLEPLKGGRAGQHSLRINDQWRICFRWEAGAHEVEIVDYH